MMHVTEKFKHLKIPLEAIILATHNFADKNCIGGGGFGKVYKGELLLNDTSTLVALKRLDPKFGQGNPEFWKEIITLSTYKHENIISLLGFCDENGEKILVYKYASKGSLDLYLNNNNLKWVTRLKICIGAARGLAYLHDPGETHQRVLHRDIKSSNILLDENWNAKISDLGLSKFGPANQQYTFLVSNAVGTIGYCDPSYVETGLLIKESDVYSFGVVLFEVLCGRVCIGNKSDKYRPLTGLVRQYYEEGKINEIIHVSLKDEINLRSLREFAAIAYQCLRKNPRERPVMAEVVSKLERTLKYQERSNSGSDQNEVGRSIISEVYTANVGGDKDVHNVNSVGSDKVTRSDGYFQKLTCRLLGAYYEYDLDSTSFAVYSILVTDADNKTWFVKRRYRNFERLHRHLKDIPNYVLHLPPKGIFSSSTDDAFVHRRILKLDKYLQDLLSIANIAEQHEVWDFLNMSSKSYSLGRSPSVLRTLAVNVGNAVDDIVRLFKWVFDGLMKKVAGQGLPSETCASVASKNVSLKADELLTDAVTKLTSSDVPAELTNERNLEKGDEHNRMSSEVR